MLNSLVAMLAGILTNFLHSFWGTARAPYLAAMVPAAIGFQIVATTWNENFGQSSKSSYRTNSETSSNPIGTFMIWFAVCLNSVFSFLTQITG
jgi:hypothetical protein